ncbi:hypothetical protein H6G80_35420 [Nostoc sp. FACHB-87]|uniref:hypothetical protein n=1 Tax=Nostocales TaxID=1161 RepID=UPI001688CCAB|nr:MULTISPECIES: hypothetical protein [Nostocales]MBD2459307.1 hypothetical protein [Nostoc sp. FACHB-87]MBD2480320.1 hypothetical protein [Anabaena sp. FACHB-83]MBD2492590.1 hypothetical protein [Aulosira sp. FACHB-615]
MYYDDLNFEEELQLSEEQIRRRHNQRWFLRRNAELLQQELELEDELINENPELAQMIHEINTLETQALHRGFGGVFEGDASAKKSNVWNKFFPGLG